MRQATAVALSALLFVGAAGSARGQTADTECPLCRAVAAFRTCATPPNGHQPFAAKVVGREKAACSRDVLWLDVVKAPGLDLPSRIKIDLGPCAYWAGQDDLIQVAVRPQAKDAKVYSLACNLWVQ